MQPKRLSDHITPFVQRQAESEEEEEILQPKAISDPGTIIQKLPLEEEEEELQPKLQPRQNVSNLQRQPLEEEEEQTLQTKGNYNVRKTSRRIITAFA